MSSKLDHQHEGYLGNQFLISMPQLEDDSFYKTVTLICQHDQNGALGIVVNRLTDHTLGDIYEQLKIVPTAPGICKMPVFEGGPVHQEFGMVIHNYKNNQTWQSTLKVSESLALTSSKDILEDIARGEGPERCLMSLGYAGWGPTQLENEILRNAWISVPVEESLLFDTGVEDKWQRAANLIGVDLNLLTTQAGHA
ncbi:MAG: YqgE/AlgH family protein [Acidiferrobacterales bacterium]|nr:YqgE/AlgH family protein [Acidiferrobacterales bacterium]